MWIVGFVITNSATPDDLGKDENIILPLLMAIWAFYLGCWIAYVYMEELAKKLEFMQHYRKQKEFQKLQGILSILMPSFVRIRIQEGARFLADEQGSVTMIFCDISDFDTIVKEYQNTEMVGLLDYVYNAFDQLCEQRGL